MALRRMSLASAEGLAESMAASTTVEQRDLLQVEPDLAGHDPAQVEKIVDQLHLRPRIAVDHFDRAPLLGRLDVGVAP